MEDSDKKEILEAIASLTQETRTGFEKLDMRLARVEDELMALSKTVDSLIEGDTLGKEHITLMDTAHLPNRFAQS
ncbi:MAG: hypothetical protein KZQ92_21025 [Candidatus Thiodiazotropha sp. (ex Lucinoma borealis)]|nr:hypothetical protein [Candidatus Thiodiazotropha sp. (ex Lucinoma borealis)]